MHLSVINDLPLSKRRKGTVLPPRRASFQLPPFTLFVFVFMKPPNDADPPSVRVFNNQPRNGKYPVYVHCDGASKADPRFITL